MRSRPKLPASGALDQLPVPSRSCSRTRSVARPGPARCAPGRGTADADWAVAPGAARAAVQSPAPSTAASTRFVRMGWVPRVGASALVHTPPGEARRPGSGVDGRRVLRAIRRNVRGRSIPGRRPGARPPECRRLPAGPAMPRRSWGGPHASSSGPRGPGIGPADAGLEELAQALVQVVGPGAGADAGALEGLQAEVREGEARALRSIRGHVEAQARADPVGEIAEPGVGGVPGLETLPLHALVRPQGQDAHDGVEVRLRE